MQQDRDVQLPNPVARFHFTCKRIPFPDRSRSKNRTLLQHRMAQWHIVLHPCRNSCCQILKPKEPECVPESPWRVVLGLERTDLVAGPFQCRMLGGFERLGAPWRLESVVR